jgi:hypothetical protein
MAMSDFACALCQRPLGLRPRLALSDGTQVHEFCHRAVAVPAEEAAIPGAMALLHATRLRWSGGTFDYFDRSDASEPTEDDEETMASAFIQSLQEKTAEAFYRDDVKSMYDCRHTSSQQAGSEQLVQARAHRPCPLP